MRFVERPNVFVQKCSQCNLVSGSHANIELCCNRCGGMLVPVPQNPRVGKEARP